MSEQDKCPKCGGTKVYAVPRTLTCTACKRSFDVDTSDQLAQAKARIEELEAECETLALEALAAAVLKVKEQEDE